MLEFVQQLILATAPVIIGIILKNWLDRKND